MSAVSARSATSCRPAWVEFSRAGQGGFLPVRFRGAEVENRTFAVGHKDRHFLDPQQQAMAADIQAWLNRMLAVGDITARQLAKRAAGNPLDS
jgi:hypothetical protein